MNQSVLALRDGALARKTMGLAIVGSGFAVIFGHGLRHLLGA